MSFSRLLILFAHPALHKSLVNRHLIAAAERVAGVTLRHLYELYPDYLIDVKVEQELLEAHDMAAWMADWREGRIFCSAWPPNNSSALFTIR